MITKLKLNHQNIHYFSDSHHFHGGKDGMSGVLKHDNRPFNNITEQDETIIRNWNTVVKKDDVVMHLGDISFASHKRTNTILEQLNGKIYLILGNHDREDDVKKLVNIVDYTPKLDLYVKDETAIDNQPPYQQIVLSHFPILQWDRKHHGSIHIHGHSHQGLTNDPIYEWYYKQMVMDVGCNGINYTPISYKEVKEIMLNKLK